MRTIKKLPFLLLLLTFASQAQEKPSRSEKRKILQKAEYAFDTGNFTDAWPQYRYFLSLFPNHELAGLNAAISAVELNYDTDSLLPLKQNLLSSSLVDAGYFASLILHQEKNFDDAIAILEKYKSKSASKRLHTLEEINYRQAKSRTAKEMLAQPHQAVIRNIGNKINSEYPDYVPVIVPDESALYFTSKRPGVADRKNADNRYFEDIYVSFKDSTGDWKKAEALPSPLNSATNDACVSISHDGQRMIIYRTAANLVSGDLYMTWLSPYEYWEEPQIIGKEINSPSIESSACFSNDTAEIYFSSDRPGGLGGKDIYRTRKLPNGQWSLPMNLGPTVNTKYDEDAPYLHPDKVTLYFSSQGHVNMGGYDIFKSTYNPDNNEYSTAENLGHPINDVKDDIFFVLSVDGQRGYYSSVKEETFGGLDIYEIDTRFKENDLEVRHGLVSLAGVAGRAQITLYDKDNGSLVGTYLSNANHGRFILIINPYKSYKLTAEADDHQVLNMDLGPLAKEKKIETIQLDLKKKERN